MGGSPSGSPAETALVIEAVGTNPTRGPMESGEEPAQEGAVLLLG